MTAADDHAAERRLEALDETLDALREINEELPVLVEGAKDVAALRELGLTGRILVVNTGGTLVELAEALAAERASRVVLLLDWDRTGGRLHRRLRELLDAHAVRWSEEHRLALVRALGNEVRSIESLPRAREALARKAAAGRERGR